MARRHHHGTADQSFFRSDNDLLTFVKLIPQGAPIPAADGIQPNVTVLLNPSHDIAGLIEPRGNQTTRFTRAEREREVAQGVLLDGQFPQPLAYEIGRRRLTPHDAWNTKQSLDLIYQGCRIERCTCRWSSHSEPTKDEKNCPRLHDCSSQLSSQFE
jgi:hypothetical protein